MTIHLTEKSFLTNRLSIQHVFNRIFEQKCRILRFQENECFEDSKALTRETKRFQLGEDTNRKIVQAYQRLRASAHGRQLTNLD